MDNYPWDVGRSETERAFLGRLEQLASGRLPIDTWTFYPQLVVTVSIGEDRELVRTLRVDFAGDSLKGGEDPSGQIDPELDSEAPDYFEVTEPLTPSGFAERAFDWFLRQAIRPIDRLEWTGVDHTWVRWKLADEGRTLVGRYRDLPDRPPDRVVRLKPPVS